jgi:hypothetical protein
MPATRLTLYNLHRGGVGRADPLAEVLLAQGADVVVMTEATDAEMFDRIAWRLGGDTFGGVGGVAISTVGTVQSAVDLVANGVSAAVGLVLAEVGWDQKTVGIVACDLGDASPQELVAATTAWRDRGLPHIVAGTINDDPSPLADADYVEATTDDHTSPTQQPAARPDRIFVSRGTIDETLVETDRLAKAAGTHFPLSVLLQMGED